MSNPTLRIGVFMGGKSIEREVSLNSGRTICDHLDTHRYMVIPLFQKENGSIYLLPYHFLHRGKISDFVHRLDSEATKITWDDLKKTVDFIYLAIHGRYAEDGTIQGMLEVLSIPYLGTKVLGSALGMNKLMQKLFMAAHGIDVAKGIHFTPHQLEQQTEETVQIAMAQAQLVFPVIVKPIHEGSSLGIRVANTIGELMTALEQACTVDPRRKQAVLIEEKLDGMEFVCVTLQKVRNVGGVITKEWFSLPITEVVIEKDRTLFDYEQKYMPGRALKITPARCKQEDQQRIIDVCTKATTILNFATISRIDGFLTTDGRVVIIDPNTLTGMAPSTFLFNQAAEVGMSHTDLINFLIENELASCGLVTHTNPSETEEESSMTQAISKKIRVAVLLGGDSNEREISLESGRNVCYKLSPHKYDVIPLFVNDFMELFKLDQKLLIKNTTKAIASLVTPDIQVQWSDLPTLCDFVFLGLHGGKGENGAVQGTVEMLDLAYNGPGVLASALCMDKYKTNDFLRSQGFDVPLSILIDKNTWLTLDKELCVNYLEQQLVATDLNFPLIVKPHDDGCSMMVNKVNDLNELQETLNNFFTSTKTSALIEELIIGMELTVGVIGNDNPEALPPSQAVAKAGILSITEKFLPGAGENQTPAPLPQNTLELVQKIMADAYKAVGCQGYSRIDCFYQTAEQSRTGSERVVILEFNTLPALTPATCLFHQAAEIGIKPMDLIDKIVELGLERHRQNHIMIEPATQQSLIDVAEETTPKKRRKIDDHGMQAKDSTPNPTMTLF